MDISPFLEFKGRIRSFSRGGVSHYRDSYHWRKLCTLIGAKIRGNGDAIFEKVYFIYLFAIFGKREPRRFNRSFSYDVSLRPSW